MPSIEPVTARLRPAHDRGRDLVPRLLRPAEGQWYCTDDDPDGEFDSVDPVRADEDLAAYHASVERARAAIDGRGLDDLAPGSTKLISLLWVFQHMIEEYARHNGHADLLRERIDGVTGD